MKSSSLIQSQIFRYILVGIGSVGIDFIVYYLLITYSRHITPSIAKRVSFIAGGIWSFFVNKLFTFRTKELKLSEPILFIVVYLVGFILNTLVHDKLVEIFRINILAFSIATFVSIVWNYFGQKLIVFRTNKNF